MDFQQQRASLVELAKQNRSYEFLQQALLYIEHCPEDAGMRLLAVGQFGRLGLAGPAIEIVDDRPDLLPADPELERSLDLLRRQPTGRIEWSGCRDVFEANLAVCCERFAVCRAHAERLRTGFQSLDLYRANDGNLLLSRKLKHGPRRWLPSLADWNGQVAGVSIGAGQANTLCMPILIEGVGFGSLLRRVYDGTRRMFLTYTPLIHLLEANVDQLAVWLNLGDHRDILRDRRFQLWLGAGAVDSLVAFHLERPQQAAPESVIRQPGWGAASQSLAADGLKRLAAQAQDQLSRARASLTEKLSGRQSRADYAERFARRAERPLRIMGITSRYTTFLQYSMRDIQQAAERRGHAFRLLIETDDHQPALPREYMLAAIDDFMPDLLLIIDHNRKEYDWLSDVRIPYCNWIQDDLPHLFGPGCGSGLDPYDIVVGTIGNYRAASSGYTRDQWLNLPVPVSAVTFSHEPVSESDLQAHACDVSFVTHRNTTPEGLLKEALGYVPAGRDDIARVIRALYELIGPQVASGRVPASAPQVVGQTVQLGRELGVELSMTEADSIRRIFTDRLVNLRFREQVLEWASDMGLDVHIYGRGWDEHPRLARHARGCAEHGYQLRCIYQASRLNIQAVASGAVHQRLMEGLFSGGSFVIRRTPSDEAGPLTESVQRRCIERNIRSEAELWECGDKELLRDVRVLNEKLYAPMRLYRGFVDDFYVADERGFSVQAGALLPHYDEVSFGTRQEFEQVVTRLLGDEPKRREIAEAQRRTVVGLFSYDALFERVLAFAEHRFARLAAESAFKPELSAV